MSVAISVVESPAELKRFVRFPLELYRGNAYWVPPLLRDEIDTLTPGRNPALKSAERQLMLAHRDGRVVGRVAAILSHAANDKYGTKNLRFGWFESIDDYEVSHALLSAVEEWGRKKGMTTLTGPQGFTDLDYEGLLVEGFEERATIATIYNPPYYPQHLERFGFAKEIDYVEFQALAPEGTVLPEKMMKMADWAAKRNNFRLLKYTNIKTLRQERGQQLFDLLDETFDELYGVTPLTLEQKNYYISRYIPFANPEFIKIAVNDANEMVGFLVSLPSLARAFQKARGRLFPAGAPVHPARAEEVRHAGLHDGRGEEVLPRQGRRPHHDHRRVSKRVSARRALRGVQPGAGDQLEDPERVEDRGDPPAQETPDLQEGNRVGGREACRRSLP